MPERTNANQREPTRTSCSPGAWKATDVVRWSHTSNSALSRLRVPAVLCILCAVVLLGNPNAARADEATLADIAQALQDWKRSWVTLRVKFERRNPAMAKRRMELDDSAPLDKFFFRQEWFWQDDDMRRHDERYCAGGDWGGLMEIGFNSRKSLKFDAYYDYGNSDKPEHLARLQIVAWNPQGAGARTSVAWEFFPTRAGVPLHALYNAGQEEWLGDTLAKGKGVLEGFDDLDGVACPRVKLGLTHIWFDPRHGLLPCRTAPVSRKQLGNDKDEWTANEFRQMETGAWFPASGTEWFVLDRPAEVESWIVTEVAPNETFDPKIFDPPKPVVGTRVENHATGQFYTAEDEESRRRAAEQTIARAAENIPKPSGNPVQANLPTWGRFGWPALMAVGAVILLAVGVRLARRG